MTARGLCAAVARIAALLLWLCPSPAAAQHPAAQTPKERASALMRDGSALYGKGDYPAALERFRRANALFPNFKIEFNIATTLQYLKRDVEAARHFARFLAAAGSRAAPEMIKEARAALNVLHGRVASLKISYPVDGAAVSLDGKAVGKTPLTSERIYLAPGRHRIEIQRPGQPAQVKAMTLKAGEHRDVMFRLSRKKAAARARRPPASRPAKRPADGDDRAAERGRMTTQAYIFLGVGSALAATAVILYGVGGSQGSEAHDEYSRLTSQPSPDLAAVDEQRKAVDDARLKILSGNVLLGLGAAAAAISVYLMLTRPPREGAGPSSAPAAALIPVRGGAACTLSGRF